jgi:hypothetical protein
MALNGKMKKKNNMVLGDLGKNQQKIAYSTNYASFDVFSTVSQGLK